MIWSKNKIIENLSKEPIDKVFFLTEIQTKKWKSDAQRRTYYRCFYVIWKHLGYSQEEIKQFFMKWCFWTREMKLWNWKYEISNISSTEDLNIEQAILLIDSLIKFASNLGLWEIITSRERQSLFWIL